MLTPQEVSEHAFQKASFGGYNMHQVDEFLDLLTVDYAALYNENAVLKNKMKVLVEKVEEYRSTEEAMRKALMTAQKIAEEMVRDAEQQKAAILAEAEKEAKARTQNIVQEIAAEEYRLAAAKSATAAYVTSVRSLLEKEMSYLEQLNELVPEQEPAVDTVEETAAEIDDSVQRLLAQSEVEIEPLEEETAPEAEAETVDLSDTTEFAAVVAEAVREELGEDEEFKTQRIDFGKLQFGRDYEIK